jgi:hypothetical protein
MRYQKEIYHSVTALLVATVWTATGSANEPLADKILEGQAAGRPITITAGEERYAGAVFSIVWNGKQFIDSYDHGREFQSASNHGLTGHTFCSEGYNPTEAGSRNDDTGPTSSSVLRSISVDDNTLSTESQLAFWLAPGQTNPPGCRAYNAKWLSEVVLRKQVTLGACEVSNLIRYQVQFEVPDEVAFNFHQFEALTGYMPSEFSVFRTWDPKTSLTASLSKGPGEQDLPIIFSTKDDQFAMGIYAFPSKQISSSPKRHGRFTFPQARSSGPFPGVVKWNAVYRYGSPKSQTRLRQTRYAFTLYVAIGTLHDVMCALEVLVKIEKTPSQ